MTIIPLLLLIFFSFLLLRVTDFLLVHVKRLDGYLKVGRFALAGFVLALATSLPELFVGIMSAFEGAPNISLGNVIGSNVTNLTIVAGLAAVLGGNLKIKNGSTKEDLLHTFVAGAAPLLLLYDRVLSRVDAVILLALYGFYNYAILAKRTTGYEDGEKQGVIYKLISRLRPVETQKELAYIFAAVAGLFIFSDIIIRLSKIVALSLNIPVFLIGLFIVALGTSLPELAFEYDAVVRGEGEMFVGNLMGSIVANGTLIIGVTALIEPIRIAALSEYTLATIFFVGAFFVFYLFTRTKKKLERWEGGVLLLIYLLFLLLELI